MSDTTMMNGSSLGEGNPPFSEEHMQRITGAKPEKKLPLMEIFGPTIQGEGSLFGQQTYFIRFGLCDYKCTMCDSMHAVNPASVSQHGERLTQEEIFHKFYEHWKPNTTNWIVYSGGNPCIHDLGSLTLNLREKGFNIAVETQGTFCPDWLQFCNHVTVSPKGPGMGEKLELDKLDEFVRWCNFWGSKIPVFSMSMKIVVFDERDIEVAAMLAERYNNAGRMILSLGNPYLPGEYEPNKDTLRHALITKYLTLLQDIQHHPVLCRSRFMPQWHVMLWGNEKGR